jgi:hypothetical protein
MNRSRWLLVWLVVLMAGLAVLALPQPVAAATEVSGDFGYFEDGVTVTTDGGAKIAIPGILNLLLAPGGTAEAGALNLGTMEVGVPNINATAKVEGLTIGLNKFGWNALIISQVKPAVGDTLTISGTQAIVQGPDTGYSTDLTAYLALQPNEAVQAEGTVGVIYDGLIRSTGVGISDGRVSINTAPASIELTGINSTQGGLTVDSMQIGRPAAGATTSLTGFEFAGGQADWDMLNASRSEMKLGNVVTLSDMQVNVAGPSAGFKTEASMNVAVDIGQLAHAEGQLVAVNDPATGQSERALRDGSAWLNTLPVSVQVTGVNQQGSTVTIDSAAFMVPPIGLEGEVNGITFGGSGATGFSDARLKYTPNPSAGGAFGGFEITLTQADGGGYTMTTTTTVDIKTGK